MKRLCVIKGNLDFVTLQVAAPTEPARGCYYHADEVEALLDKLLLLAGAKDGEAALRAIIAEVRKAREARG